LLSNRRIGIEYIAVFFVVAVGIFARLYDIHANFDVDEIFSVKLATKTFSEVIAGSLQDRTHPSLHNILLHFWLMAFGATEAAARSLSVLASVFFLVFAFLFLRKICDKWVAVGVTLIFAISPYFVFYGQQARPYALIALLSCANILFFLNILDNPACRKHLAAWACSCALLLNAQYMGVFLIGSEMLVAWLYLPGHRWRVSAWGAAGCAFVIPWIAWAMGASIAGGVDPIHQIDWLKAPTLTTVLRFYASFFGTTWWLFEHMWLIAAILAFLVAMCAWSCLRERRVPPAHVLLVLVGVAFPVAVFAVSVLGPKPIFLGRQLIAAAIAAFAGLGVCFSLYRRPVAIGFLALVAVWILRGVPESYRLAAERPPWKEMAQFIDATYGSRELLADENWVRNSVEFYRQGGSVRKVGDLSELKEGTIFLCRRSKCPEMDAEALGMVIVERKSMEWRGEFWGDNLLLFELRRR
jgi:uncharacterized membrane protein